MVPGASPYPRQSQEVQQKLPAISLGLWHNFGGIDSFENGRAMLRRAFDLGITHFDLANNYGPPAGSAELMFGQMLKEDFRPYLSAKGRRCTWTFPRMTRIRLAKRSGF